MKRKSTMGALLTLTVMSGLFAGDYSIRQLKLNHPDGFYRAGEEVVVTGQLFKGNVPAAAENLCVVTKWEGKEVGRREIPGGGKSFRISYKTGQPGWVYFGFMVIGPDGKIIEKPGA